MGRKVLKYIKKKQKTRTGSEEEIFNFFLFSTKAETIESKQRENKKEDIARQ
jgi:hypothetical protein